MSFHGFTFLLVCFFGFHLSLAIKLFFTQVKPKMVMTVFAVLMSRDFQPNMDSRK